MSEWISVKDRLPNNRDRVAFVAKIHESSIYHYMNGEVFGGTFHLQNNGVGLFSYPGHSMEASYWMELPEPPND